MGLFNKLKNALFEEEEIEVRPQEEKAVIKEESVPTIKKEVPVKEELPKENERDLFKAENTFKFPDFDEEEFVTSYTPKEPEIKPEPAPVKPKEEPRKFEFDRLSPLGYDGDRKSKVTRKEPPRREKSTTTQKSTETKSGFRPSPVISPVYGVLDKNYKKEDIISLEEEKKKFNVDMARKKAFGTLEEDIEKTMHSVPEKKFHDTRAKNLDDLLTSSSNDSISLEDTIEVPAKRMTRNSKKGRPYKEENEEEYNDLDNFNDSIEQEFDVEDENLEVLDKTPKEKDIDEDTLESDLFDLIDSMYDNREEE